MTLLLINTCIQICTFTVSCLSEAHTNIHKSLWICYIDYTMFVLVGILNNLDVL